jgi:prepilin-type N-terminal cleavage/methylation domain-containing protein
MTIPRAPACRGFTLVELLVATSLSAIVFAGVLSAYLFIGRNLTRLVNFQQQEVESRRTLRYLTEDVSAATVLTTATASRLDLTKPASGGSTAISYVYSPGDQTLTRTDPSGTRTLLTGLTDFSLLYYNRTGMAIASSLLSVKSIELSFSSTAGSAASGTLASYSTVSPRIVMRNKPVLE